MNPQLAAFLGFLRRYPYGAACAFVSLLLAGLIWHLRGSVADLDAVHRERAREGEAMLALLVGGSTQRQELALVRETVRRIEDNLLIETNLTENLWYFYKLEEQTKARLPGLHQLNSPPGDRSPLYKRIPYTVRVTGTYEQVGSFLLALETGPRLVAVTDFSYTSRDGTNVSLDLSIELLGKK